MRTPLPYLSKVNVDYSNKIVDITSDWWHDATSLVFKYHARTRSFLALTNRKRLPLSDHYIMKRRNGLFSALLDRNQNRIEEKYQKREMATVGGVSEIEGSQNSVEIDSLARFAVDEYNKKEVRYYL